MFKIAIKSLDFRIQHLFCLTKNLQNTSFPCGSAQVFLVVRWWVRPHDNLKILLNDLVRNHIIHLLPLLVDGVFRGRKATKITMYLILHQNILKLQVKVFKSLMSLPNHQLFDASYLAIIS